MSTTYLKFKHDSPETQALADWWQSLDDNRGDRAELRRCTTLAEVVFTPAYHRLRFAVGKFGTVNVDALALVAGLAAQIDPLKSNLSGYTLAEQMATPKDSSSKDGKAKVSGLRFRRLLKIKEREYLFTAMRRVVALLGSSINLQSLARSVYLWDDRYTDIRKEWAFEYYTKSPSEQ
ncbi:MAG: type I-E CRISPR-associated protein Cse2/CasB [Syntrophales bacterium LBB04]|nr:type I-E CRISPR-associated protein Cse2/CasB [Syntrophales bacterium LBB04]